VGMGGESVHTDTSFVIGGEAIKGSVGRDMWDGGILIIVTDISG